MLTQVSEVVPVPAWSFSLLVLSCGGCRSVTAKMLRNLLALRQIGQRTISTTSRRHFKNKVPEKQKLFQEQHMPCISWLWLHFPRSRSDFNHPSNHLVQFHSALYGPVI
ncbi:cytochrome c oxidase subunit 7A2, mitochondrial isoform X2 [Chlorocebus sabaeus]